MNVLLDLERQFYIFSENDNVRGKIIIEMKESNTLSKIEVGICGGIYKAQTETLDLISPEIPIVNQTSILGQKVSASTKQEFSFDLKIKCLENQSIMDSSSGEYFHILYFVWCEVKLSMITSFTETKFIRLRTEPLARKPLTDIELKFKPNVFYGRFKVIKGTLFKNVICSEEGINGDYEIVETDSKVKTVTFHVIRHDKLKISKLDFDKEYNYKPIIIGEGHIMSGYNIDYQVSIGLEMFSPTISYKFISVSYKIQIIINFEDGSEYVSDKIPITIMV